MRLGRGSSILNKRLKLGKRMWVGLACPVLIGVELDLKNQENFEGRRKMGPCSST